MFIKWQKQIEKKNYENPLTYLSMMTQLFPSNDYHQSSVTPDVYDVTPAGAGHHI